MHLKQRKGMWEITLISVGLVLFILFALFYAGVKTNISKGEKMTAEIVQSDVELRAFFSQLTQEKGKEIAESDGTAAKAIQEFAKKGISIPRGSYSASCVTKNNDRQCSLTVTLDTTLETILGYTYFTPVVGQVVYGYWVALKYIGLGEMKSTVEETYLPTKKGIMNFKLTTMVRAI